jgi:hypothetical protein
MQLKNLINTTALFIAMSMSAGHAAEDDARASQIMYNAWMCSTYASMKGDADEQGRLFTLGYSKGKQFTAAAFAGTITAEEGQTMIPVIVGLLMAGPTEEFVLGRIYETAANQAFDDIVTKNVYGIPLAPADYVTDEKLQATIAKTKFLKANCELLR